MLLGHVHREILQWILFIPLSLSLDFFLGGGIFILGHFKKKHRLPSLESLWIFLVTKTYGWDIVLPKQDTTDGIQPCND